MNIVISQAEATGLPVIATNHSGFPEQVKEGWNGFLVPEGNYRALADKIIYLVEHPELWPELSTHTREHVLVNYDSKRLIAKQVNLYQKIIKPT